jgi:hypothetical protein
MTVGKLFELYPNALVMQLDEAIKGNYYSLGRFEKGKSKGKLTRTDSLSWQDKSWVVGIQNGNASKAYDWNQLKELRIINDKVGGKAVVLVLASDNQSFAAFERSSEDDIFTTQHDSLFVNGAAYNLSVKDVVDPTKKLKRVKAYQEFWHSWKTFHPQTEQYH